MLPFPCTRSQAEYVWQISEIHDKYPLTQGQASEVDCFDSCTNVGARHQWLELDNPILMSCSSDYEDFHLQGQIGAII